MLKSRASETARLALLMRAAHQVIDAEEKILADSVAVGLVLRHGLRRWNPVHPPHLDRRVGRGSGESDPHRPDQHAHSRGRECAASQGFGDREDNPLHHRLRGRGRGGATQSGSNLDTRNRRRSCAPGLRYQADGAAEDDRDGDGAPDLRVTRRRLPDLRALRSPLHSVSMTACSPAPPIAPARKHSLQLDDA